MLFLKIEMLRICCLFICLNYKDIEYYHDINLYMI